MKTFKLVDPNDLDHFGKGKMDISIDTKTGQIDLLEKEKLLYQSVLKIILTGIQEDYYGSKVYLAIGGKGESVIDKAFIYFTIIDALIFFRKLQTNYYLRRELDITELTASQEVLDRGLRILISPFENQTFKVFLTVMNQKGSLLEATFTVEGI